MLQTEIIKEKILGYCTNCNTQRVNPMDLFSIDKQGRCVDCAKKKVIEEGFDAAKNKYKVYIRIVKEITVYAKNEDEAEEQALENFFPEEETPDVETTLLKEAIA